MKKLLVLFLILLFTSACMGLPTQETPDIVVSPPGSPSPTPTAQIIIPTGPARTHMFGLPWTRTEKVRPLSDSLRYNSQWNRLCYEGLFELDETLTPRQSLCVSCNTDDNRVYTIALREEVSFHNGEPLSANDVVYSFSEARKPDSPYSSRFDTVSSVTSLDELTVEVVLTKPMARFTALLDFPIVWSGSPQLDASPGTGPYSLHIDEHEGTYLLAFDSWWRDGEIAPRRIELVHIESQDDLAYYFQNGTVSLTTIDPYDLVSPQVHSGMEMWRVPTSNMVYIGFNTAQKPLDDPMVRRAISMALDRTAIAKAAYGSYAVPSAVPAPPAASEGISVNVHDYDFGAAVLLMEDLGYIDEDYDEVLEYQVSRYLRRPFELDILVAVENPAKLEIARICAEQLSLLGIRAVPRPVTWESYLAALNSGAYGLYIGEVRLSAELSVERFVSSGGEFNYSGYRDNELNALLEELAAKPSYAQKAAYGKVWQRLLDEVPFMTLCFREVSLGAQRGLINSPTPLGWNELYKFTEWITG